MIKYIKVRKGIKDDFPESLPAVNIFKYLSEFCSVSQFTEEVFKNKTLVLPSIFSKNNATCFASAIGGLTTKLGVYNYLFFFDQGRVFCVLQHHSFVSLVFLVDLSCPSGLDRIASDKEIVIAVTSQSIFSGVADELTDEFLKLAKSLSHDRCHPCVVCAFLDGYQRPYHYFYDRLPWLVAFLKSFSVCRIESLSSSRFIDLKGVEYRYVDEFIGRLRYDRISVIPSRVGKGRSKKLLASDVVSSVQDLLGKFDSKCFDVVVWLGMCEEKRPWPEKKEAFIGLLKKLNESGLRYHIYFDGLTRPNDTDLDEFQTKYCTKENQLLDEVLEAVAIPSFKSLIAATALEKLSASCGVDFYFSNGLTDSMWCAHFYRKPGLAYLSSSGIAFQHSHPKTSFIATDRIRSLENHKNWARVGLSMNPDFVSDLLFEDVLVASKIKKNMSFRAALKRISSPDAIKIVEPGIVFDKVEIRLGQGKKYIPLDGCSCGFEFSRSAVKWDHSLMSMSLDAEVHGDVSMRLYAIFYSTSGSRVEHFSVRAGEACKTFSSSKASVFFRLFYRFSGNGLAMISGFRLAPG